MRRAATRRRGGRAGALTLSLALACACAVQDGPADVRLHRLNRAEYNNSLRDLLGVDLQPADEFPDDAPSHGFDNNAAVLGVTPMTFELHARAVERAVAVALEGSGGSLDAAAFCPRETRAPACAESLVESFAPRAWRRPLTAEERESLDQFVAQNVGEGDDVGEAARLVLEAVLTSPNFLFRAERLAPTGETASSPLGEYELAARLSYFLWSSTPDDALLAAARTGALAGGGLEAQARRMLADPRARALTDNFGGQWLAFRELDDVFKDASRFPEFDDELRASMREEARRFFSDFVDGDRDLRELLTARETFVDGRLAAYYGIPDVDDGAFTRVALDGTPRRGVLTQAGLLSVLSYPFTTSPARRGAWVLDRLLCQPPPPPPEGVDTPFDADEGATKRDEFEQHSEDPACASCHQTLDPLGLALERFDAAGQYRELENGLPIETAGTLPTGESFADAAELAGVLAADPAFVECLVEQVMVYALGRGLEREDHQAVGAIAEELGRRGYRARELFVLVATSEPFLTRLRAAEGP